MPQANIGWKSWMHITEALADYRTAPTAQGFKSLQDMLEKYDWPWSMTPEQGQEWREIMQRTRPAFEAAISALTKGQGDRTC